MREIHQFTKNQLEAINSYSGYNLVLAGAGSGKTSVLTTRDINLINSGVDEESILSVTFTRKAAAEMIERETMTLGREPKSYIGTLHAFSWSYLRELKPDGHKLIVIDETTKISIVKQIIINDGYKEILNAQEVSHSISKIKNKMILPKLPLSYQLKIIKLFYSYQKHCEENKKIDYDQMNYEFLELLKTNEQFREVMINSYEYISVDECQDLNRIQAEIIFILSSINKNLFLVGDQDQTIYEWRGSDSRIMNEFIHEYNPKIIKLEECFRCDAYIVDAANKLIENNFKRLDKTLIPIKPNHNKPVFKSCLNQHEESNYITKLIKHYYNQGIAYKDIMILYRNNMQVYFIEPKLKLANIPYYMNQTSLLNFEMIKLLINYLRALTSKDNDALMEIINKPGRNIGPARITSIITHAANDQLTKFEAAKELNDKYINKFFEDFNHLELEITKQHPACFLRYLVDYLNLKELIEKKDNQKDYQRIEAFIQLFEDYHFNSNYKEEIHNFLNELLLDDVKVKSDTVSLSTIHQAKGLESKVVIIAGLTQSIIPSNRHEVDIEAERRIMYVALTRAKDYLHLTYYKKSFDNKTQYYSEFINELGDNLIIDY